MISPGPKRLEYAIAFDLVAAALERAGGPGGVLAVVTAPIFLHEVLLRCSWALTVVATTPGAREALRSWTTAPSHMGSTLGVSVVDDVRHLPGQGFFRGIIWAAPEEATWSQHLFDLDRRLQPGGVLCVLGAGPLGWLTRPMRQGWGPGEPSWPITGRGGLVPAVRAGAYRGTHLVGLGGLPSVTWAALGRLSTLVGRPDWDDRCQAAYRGSLAQSGMGAQLAALSLAVCHKRGQA